MLNGLDISNWQGTVDWAKVKADGISFVLMKATEGTSYVDPTFQANWKGAAAVGLVRGAYSFTRPEMGNANAQADFFVQTVNSFGGWSAGDLAAGDFETPDGGTDQSAFALAWLAEVQIRIGFAPLLYCNQDWAANRLTIPALRTYPLWLAAYDPKPLPKGIGVWPSVALQQYSDHVTVAGISGTADGDRLERTIAQLKALGKPASATYQINKTASLISDPYVVVQNLPKGARVIPTGVSARNGFTQVTTVTAKGTVTGWIGTTSITPV